MNILKRLSGSSEDLKIEISGPSSVSHLVHIDNDFNWNFEDSSIDSKDIFEKIRVIGKGGFGTVVELLHKPSGLNLAGKMLSKEMVSRATKESLKKEIELMKKIRTPYTISYYGNVEFEGDQTLLMEFCKCGSLRDIMDDNKTPLNEIQIKCVMHDLLNALKRLHKDFAIIHRDIKAGNILLSKDGKLKVSDFGVSRQFEDKQNSYSTSSTVGTPYWMAPEVINGLKYSFPADVWSVGATAIELFENAPPYSEFPLMRAMVLIATQGFQGFRENSHPTPEFEDFIRKCMIIDPALRATVDDLLAHPFLKDVESINREETFKDLLTHEVVYHPPEEEEEEQNENNDLNTENRSLQTNTTNNNEDEEEEIIIEEEEEEEVSDDGLKNIATVQFTKSPIKQKTQTKEQTELPKVGPTETIFVSKNESSNNEPSQTEQKNEIPIVETKNSEPIQNIILSDIDLTAKQEPKNDESEGTVRKQEIEKSIQEIVNDMNIKSDPKLLYTCAAITLLFGLIFGGKSGLFSVALFLALLYYVAFYRM